MNTQYLIERKLPTTYNYNDVLLAIKDNEELITFNTDLMNAVSYLLKKTQQKEIKSKSISDPFKLASLFKAKNDTRYFLNWIYSDGNNLIGSNGHTLIKIAHEVELGFYNDLGIYQDDMKEVAYPKFEKVFESLHGSKEKTDINLNENKFELSYITPAKEKTYTANKYKLHSGLEVAFKTEYVNIYKKLGVENVIITSSCMYAKKDNFEAVIMSMRV